MIRIAIDAMGGDFGPDETIPAALTTLGQFSDLALVLVGDEARISTVLGAHNGKLSERLQLLHAPETVEMHDSPVQVLRNKKNSSMYVALHLLKKGEVSACVSSGNTGALMVMSRQILKMLPGVERPAICTALPGLTRTCHALDLGANSDCTPQQLLQFAVMGTELVSVLKQIERPTVGLLNVGKEKIKGNELIKSAAALLENSPLNYIGYVEGDDVYIGDGVDVVVCDGFSGNIMLKASEGVSQFVFHVIQREFRRNAYHSLIGWLAKPVFRNIHRELSPKRYNGASLLGVNGIVIKSHGSADRCAFARAIEVSLFESRQNIPERLSNRLSRYLPAG